MKHKRSLVTASLFLCLVLGALLALAFAATRGPDGLSVSGRSGGAPQPETPRSAYDFVNSIGVNTHLNYFDRLYGNFNLVEREMRSSGILHVRDGMHLLNPDYNQAVYSRWIRLGKLGVRFDAVVDPRSKLPPLTPDVFNTVNTLAGGTIESFEGPNELDINNIPDWPKVDRDFQTKLFNAVEPMAGGRIKVIGPSIALARHGISLGDLSAEFDYGNLHPYPAGKMPSAIFPEQTLLAKVVSGDKPIVFTETGYHNALNDHHDQPAVSEAAAAKYVPRLFLENFARGIPRTYLYELLDEAPNPALDDNQMHWGLIRNDGSEKPAFTALKNLIDELRDSAPASPAPLAWSLTSGDSRIHHLLLQKSNGAYDLVLWQEVTSYDTRQQADIANPPLTATLTLAQAAAHVTVFAPSAQPGPQASFAHTAKIPLSIPDAPLVVEIAPR